MPVFMIERELAESFDPDDDALRHIDEYNSSHDIKWLTSFLSADRKRTYCLYEADDAEALRRHAADLGIPADSIVQVEEFVR